MKAMGQAAMKTKLGKSKRRKNYGAAFIMEEPEIHRDSFEPGQEMEQTDIRKIEGNGKTKNWRPGPGVSTSRGDLPLDEEVTKKQAPYQWWSTYFSSTLLRFCR